MSFGDCMIFKVNYDRVYFDRFENINKAAEARYIVEKALEEIECEARWDAECFEIEEDSEKHIKFEKMRDVLKREFFVLIEECAKEKEESHCEMYENLVRYIRRHYQYDTLTVDEACESVNISRYAADRYMQKTYSVTTSEYIRNLRVEKAKEMLKEDVTVEMCAGLCGFGSVKSMQRAFKSVCNLSPGAWRSSNLDSKEGK